MAAAASATPSASATLHASAYQLPSGETVVRIQGEESSTYRAPVHFIIALDTSGSMDTEHKLESVVRSLHFMLDLMTQNDELSLLTFSSEVSVPFKRVKLNTENREAVRFLLQSLRANGGTNLSGGLVTSRECLYESTTLKQGILLLTDGHANIGATDPAVLQRQAATLLEDYHGLTVSCVGYGTDHNAGLLTDIAGNGGGSYNVVSNLEDVATVFGDVLGGLQATIAQELKVHVPITTTQITPFPGHPAIFLGDLQAGGEHVVLLRTDTDTPPEITLSAYETATGRPLHHTLSVSLSPTDAEVHFGKVALLRIQVVNFLKKIQVFLTPSSTSASASATEQRMGLEAERIRLLAAVEDLTVEPNPLLQLLRDELQNAEQLLLTPLRAPQYARQSSTIVTQHVAHLGYARGVRCDVGGGGGGAGAGATVLASMPPRAPALTNTFSSPCQRTVSHMLRQSTGADPTATATGVADSQEMDEIE
jgi:Mg-chelatase subunit ChlD